ncbi:hypothetical protein GALL_318760 [mine drainage metagenome]|uniref:Uncharacterized protein n=1 Tax=mine drainage metagenome TaxID=410659 RepID=A0A1J5R2I8_9ZZZZ
MRRIEQPSRRTLSHMNIPTDASTARNAMFSRTHVAAAPSFVACAGGKKRARLSLIIDSSLQMHYKHGKGVRWGVQIPGPPFHTGLRRSRREWSRPDRIVQYPGDPPMSSSCISIDSKAAQSDEESGHVSCFREALLRPFVFKGELT